uniref:Uncharacterized protein n=1 Tax=Romanomermis culicivorax TaxID=13658 RepID=A0A915IS55_ROMCU
MSYGFNLDGHPGYRGPGWQKCIKDGKWIAGCSPPGGAGSGFDFKIDVPVIKYKKEPKKRRRSNQWRQQQLADAQAMLFAVPPRMPDHYYAGGNGGLASDAAFRATPYAFDNSGSGQQWQSGQQVPSYSELLKMYWQARSQQPMQGPMGPPISIPYGFGQTYK